jgi:Transglutaminase-like superfamily
VTADDLLNLAARVLLRVYTPSTVHLLMTNVGRLLPKRDTAAEVRAAAARLRPRGTCLTRALALAARSPHADVIIGVKPNGRKGIDAHAWIEVDGMPLHSSDPSGEEIARLRGMGVGRKRGFCWAQR